jgi:hypothetical protein
MSDPGHLVAESLAKLADYAAYASEKNPAVSAWSVGMQIHHALLAAYGILSSLIAS